MKFGKKTGLAVAMAALGTLAPVAGVGQAFADVLALQAVAADPAEGQVLLGDDGLTLTQGTEAGQVNTTATTNGIVLVVGADDDPLPADTAITITGHITLTGQGADPDGFALISGRVGDDADTVAGFDGLTIGDGEGTVEDGVYEDSLTLGSGDEDNFAGSLGAVALNNGQLIVEGEYGAYAIAGLTGTGDLTVNGGILTVGGNATLASLNFHDSSQLVFGESDLGAPGTLVVASQLTVTGDLTFNADATTAQLIIDGGDNDEPASLTAKNVQLGNADTNVITKGQMTIVNGGTLTLGTFDPDAAVDPADPDAVANTAALTIEEQGTLVLGEDSDTTQTVTVANGHLALEGGTITVAGGTTADVSATDFTAAEDSTVTIGEDGFLVVNGADVFEAGADGAYEVTATKFGEATFEGDGTLVIKGDVAGQTEEEVLANVTAISQLDAFEALREAGDAGTLQKADVEGAVVAAIANKLTTTLQFGNYGVDSDVVEKLYALLGGDVDDEADFVFNHSDAGDGAFGNDDDDAVTVKDPGTEGETPSLLVNVGGEDDSDDPDSFIASNLRVKVAGAVSAMDAPAINMAMASEGGITLDGEGAEGADLVAAHLPGGEAVAIQELTLKAPNGTVTLGKAGVRSSQHSNVILAEGSGNLNVQGELEITGSLTAEDAALVVEDGTTLATTGATTVKSFELAGGEAYFGVGRPQTFSLFAARAAVPGVLNHKAGALNALDSVTTAAGASVTMTFEGVDPATPGLATTAVTLGAGSAYAINGLTASEAGTTYTLLTVSDAANSTLGLDGDQTLDTLTADDLELGDTVLNGGEFTADNATFGLEDDGHGGRSITLTLTAPQRAGLGEGAASAVLASLPQVALATVSAVYGLIDEHAALATATPSFGDAAGNLGVWASPFYKYSQFDGTGFGYDHEINLGGGLVGLDYNVADNFRLGVALSAGGGTAKGDGRDRFKVEDDFNFFGASLYGSYAYGALTVAGDLGYTAIGHDMEVKGLGAKDKPDTDAFTVGLSGRYKLALEAMDVTPHLGLRYIGLSGDDANFGGDKVETADARLFQVPVGVTLGKDLATQGGWTVSPKADLGAVFTMGDTDTDGRALLKGAAPLALNADITDTAAFKGGLGLKADNGNGFSLGLDYTLLAGRHQTDHGVAATLRYEF